MICYRRTSCNKTEQSFSSETYWSLELWHGYIMSAHLARPGLGSDTVWTLRIEKWRPHIRQHYTIVYIHGNILSTYGNPWFTADWAPETGQLGPKKWTVGPQKVDGWALESNLPGTQCMAFPPRQEWLGGLIKMWLGIEWRGGVSPHSGLFPLVSLALWQCNTTPSTQPFGTM